MSQGLTVRILVAGALLLQLCWLVAVPPFRGMDEWDHAYRAAAVADGQWRAAPTSATRGTGAEVDVPVDVVDAARAECERLGYTGPEECVGTDQEDGTARVASGAGRYHPLFYAVTGYLTLPVEGVARLWAMRGVAVLACLVVLGLAIGSTRRWSVGPGAWVGLVVSLTPTVLYSSTVMAPNGLEMMAGLAAWSSLIGLLVTRDDRHDTYYLVVLAIAGALLVSVRSLGPLWLALIVATALLAIPLDRGRVGAVARRPLAWVCVATISAATAASVGWAMSQRALEVGDGDGTVFSVPGRLVEAAGQVPVWLLQAIGAFPYRDQPAPLWVHACWLLLGGAVLVAGIRAARRRVRWALILGLLASVLVPSVVTFLTVNAYGTAWQGRYGMPFAMGLFLLAGHARDLGAASSGGPLGISPRLWVPGLVLFSVGSLLGPLSVLLAEHGSPSAGTSAWPAPHPVFLAVLAGLAAAAVWQAAVRSVHDPSIAKDNR